METIDLRSDTVSWPLPEMREAMANAPVGDDVYGEDPTINQLQQEAADMLGKEAGLFVSSGTQGNIVAALTHCGRGDEMILAREAHMFRYEQGASAALGGIQPNILDVQPDGTLRLDAIKRAIRGDDQHFPRTKLICLENTQGTIGGIPITAEYTNEVGAIARENGLKLHIDGARLFNAATALDTPVNELVAAADSVSFCLSKGLCAPVGSVLVGSKAFIHEAHRTRKILGGGMRQAGILAAAGLIALRKMTKRLHEDHANACSLAEGIAEIPHLSVDLSRVKTNMFFFDVADNAPITADELRARLKAEYNLLIGGFYGMPNRVRLVTHYWITPEKVDAALSAIREVMS
ncbi:MAG: low-specificity L-threonine aldolase [Chloroflexi bacterium]|nr:low-specificity L-threonine aldolase [Chloroflexota bacterium]MCC6894285.1 low-specificity L-threonine aldolase [Anaerolineae bacterium]